MQKLIEKMTGYKATDANMQCKPDPNKPAFQFELGKWYEHEGDLILCQSGFHFCEQPSGVWSYHSDPGTRIFKVEAEGILQAIFEPGADFKRVCRRIRLVEEIKVDGQNNTGHRNTGNGNTGNGNTGYRNTGDGNTGNRNTGYRNTGYRNTGDGNTGHRNTGDRNTGDGNTGDGNTGHRNTGDGNTGYRNTGHGNTGDGNTGDFHSGFFCSQSEKVLCFGTRTKFTRKQFQEKFGGLVYDLCEALAKDAPIDFKTFAKLPNITKTKLAKLHKLHIEGRAKK